MKYIKEFKHSLIITEIIFGLFFFSVVLFIQIIQRRDYDLINLYTVRNNWYGKPISDIKESDNICQDDYSYLFNIFFPGTSSGCECGNSLIDTKGVTCTFTQILNNCYNVESKNADYINIYKNKTLCVKKLQSNYLSIWDKLSNDTNCKEGNNCGIIDSLNNTYCSNNCPINSLYFSDDNSGANNFIQLKNLINKEYKDYYLIFNNKTNNLTSKIYSDIRLGSGKYVCNRQSYFNYMLFSDCYFNNFFIDRCRFFDKYFDILDNLSGLQFYLNFNAFETFYYDLPSCSDSNRYTNKTLFGNVYHGLSINCDKIKVKSLIELIMLKNDFQIELISILSICLNILIFYYFLLNLLVKWYMLITNENPRINIIVLIELILSLMLIFLFIIFNVQKSKVGEELEVLEYFINNKCGDEYVNLLVDELYSYQQIVIQNLETGLYFSILGSFVFPIKLIFLLVKSKKRDEVNIIKDNLIFNIHGNNINEDCIKEETHIVKSINNNNFQT